MDIDKGEVTVIRSNNTSIIYVIYKDFNLLKSTILHTIKFNPREIIVVDNSPVKNDVSELPYYHSLKYFHQPENLGYAGGANFGCQKISSQSEWVTIMNADAYFSIDYFNKINNYLNEFNDVINIGAVGGKLKKVNFKENKETNYIDSAGISINRAGVAIDMGQNELDNGQYNNSKVVDGICGALVTYKINSLMAINRFPEIFDSKFIAYKEDVEVSIELKKGGFKSLYVYDALAFHGRGLGSIKKWPIAKFIRAKKNQSFYLKVLSRSNHWYIFHKHKDFIFNSKVNISFFFIRTLIEIIFLMIIDFKVLKQSLKRYKVLTQKDEGKN